MDLTPCHGCDHCGLRCEAGVQMSREEYQTVHQFVAGAPNRLEIEQITLQDKSIDLGDGVSVQMCLYRDMEHGKCAVYPVRPLICRLLGHVEWMPCPIEKVKKLASTTDALELMSAYALEERRTFDEWEKVGEIQ